MNVNDSSCNHVFNLEEQGSDSISNFHRNVWLWYDSHVLTCDSLIRATFWITFYRVNEIGTIQSCKINKLFNLENEFWEYQQLSSMWLFEIKFSRGYLTWFLNTTTFELTFYRVNEIERFKLPTHVFNLEEQGSEEYQQLSSMWLWDKKFHVLTWFLNTSNFLNNFLSSQRNWTIQVAIMFLIWKRQRSLRISATFINVALR